VAVLLVSLATGCDERFVVEDYGLRGSLSSESIPTQVSEALERIYEIVPDATNDALLRCETGPMDEFCLEFSTRVRDKLRRQISNEWMRSENSPLADAYILEGISNPEVMSYALLDNYVQYIKALSSR
jgi:hypothetical protein